MRQVLANILAVVFTTVSLLAAQPPNTPGTASSNLEVARPEKGKVTNSAKAKAVSHRHKGNSKPYQIGKASWYGKSFHGKTTASGEPYDMFEFTAAHRRLPLGTLVKVTNLDNGRSVVVRVNDRGPVPRSRIIDLSYGAARMLGMPGHGVEPVRLDVVQSSTLVAQSQNLAGMP